MNSSTKVFSILSLSAAIGNILANSNGDDRIKWRGQKLHEAGFEATQRYPFPPLTTSKIRQIEKKVDEVCQHERDINIIETLAFLIAGLVDIRAYIKPDKWFFLDPVLTRATWCLDLVDSKCEQEEIYAKAFEDFERWAI